MAGVAGIIRKHKQRTPMDTLQSMLERAASKLTIHRNVSALNRFSIREDVALHVSVAAGDSIERKIVDERERNGVLIALDGEVFVDESEKRTIQKQYPQSNPVHEIQYLPLLYQLYGRDFHKKIYGQYNILFCDPSDAYITLFNDRLGVLPFYVFENEEYFMFSSKIESILASGILKTIQFDPVSVSEHLLFHYTLSDHTYIRGIRTLPHATRYTFQQHQIEKEAYWEPGEFFGISPTGRSNSIDRIDDAIRQSIQRMIQRSDSPVHFSLTGGWDSRVILSCLLSQHRDHFRSYSFGAPGSDDIEIPRQIAEMERFSYQSYPLDASYLSNHFLEEASDTIQFSNGTRNYKRAHYLYTIRRLPSCPPHLLTGIFGDEVFKVGMPQGGSVIAKSVVHLLKHNFDKDAVQAWVQRSGIQEYVQLERRDVEELISRVSDVGSWLQTFEQTGERYFAFRFCLNLRKYFGAEMNSYNDFVNCFSPFIDHQFLKSFSKTAYMISNYEFKQPGIKEKYRSSRLYYELVRRNYEPLTGYRTSRGFSMKETGTLPGMVNIWLKKYIKKRLYRAPDAFNTDGTDKLFQDAMLRPSYSSNPPSILTQKACEAHPGNTVGRAFQKEDLFTIQYWLQHISRTYVS